LLDRHWHVPGEWSFLRCPGDGVLWLSPRPIDEDLPRCYPGAYFTHAAPQPAPSEKERPAKERLRRRVLAAVYGYSHLNPGRGMSTPFARMLLSLPPIRRVVTHNLGAFMLPFRKNGRLLEVGCGSGEYLRRMRDCGWDVAGIEPDEEAAQVARDEHGLSVFPGFIGDAPFPEASFDVIACRHVLEHVSAPLPFLETISRLLKPGGQLIAVTPNALSLGHRVFQGDFYSLDPPRHLVLYTPAGIECLLRRTADLRLLSLRTPTRIARKVFRHGRAVRKHGTFRAPGPAATAGERLLGLLFATVEVSAAVVWPVGEEIEFAAVREEPGTPRSAGAKQGGPARGR
jgi:2-polyprenyl-3-methyl-5-hydroxy-6-metoxy-1,4-benzoquinol methylase